MSRTAARRHAFKLIFMFEFLHRDQNEVFENYLYDFAPEINEYDRGIIYDEFIGVYENLSEIDAMINECSKWSFSRLNKIDLDLIRLAVYELSYEKNKPPVVIKEIVDLANRYGTKKSPGFVNGILASIVMKIKNSDYDDSDDNFDHDSDDDFSDDSGDEIDFLDSSDDY